MAGRRAEARAIERRLERRAQARYIDPEAFALVDIGVGDTARALGWLERGARERSFYLPLIGADPVFAPLHGNPRFLEIVRTIGLHLPSDSAR
jgi:hypothetical protein